MILPPISPNVCNELHIIGVTCTFNGKGIIKRHPASQHTSHFLSSLAKETLIYPQIIPQPDHKLLAAPYLVTPPAMLALAHKTIQQHGRQALSGVFLRMGQPWAEVKSDVSQAGCLSREWKFCGWYKEKERNCHIMEGYIANCDLDGKGGWVG